MNSRRSTLFTAFFIFFIDNFGYALVFPLFSPVLLNPAYGILPAGMSVNDKNILLGVLIAAYPLAQFFGAPIFGDIADQFGRKRGFFFTMTGIIVGYALTAIALMERSYAFLLVGRLFTGFFAGNWSIVFATLADLSESEKERARNFGWIAALGGVSWVLSMLVGGDLSNPRLLSFSSPALALWITLAISVIGLLLIIFFFEEPRLMEKKMHFNLLKGFEDLKLAFKLKGLRSYFLVLLCYALGWMMLIAWLNPTVLEKFHENQTVSTFVLIGLGVVWGLSSSFLNRFVIAKFPLKKAVTLCLFLLALSLAITSFVPVFWLFVLFSMLATLFAPLTWSNLLNLISFSATKDVQGITMGIGQSVMSFAQILAPLIAGVISAFRISLVFTVAGLIAFMGVLLLLKIKTQLSEQKADK